MNHTLTFFFVSLVILHALNALGALDSLVQRNSVSRCAVTELHGKLNPTLWLVLVPLLQSLPFCIPCYSHHYTCNAVLTVGFTWPLPIKNLTQREFFFPNSEHFFAKVIIEDADSRSWVLHLPGTIFYSWSTELTLSVFSVCLQHAGTLRGVWDAFLHNCFQKYSDRGLSSAG